MPHHGFFFFYSINLTLGYIPLNFYLLLLLPFLFSFLFSLGLVRQYPLLQNLYLIWDHNASKNFLLLSKNITVSAQTNMPAVNSNDTPVNFLDFKSAIDVMKKEYPRDGLDARSLLDSGKHGGLT